MRHSHKSKHFPGLTDILGVLIGLAFLLVVPSLSGDPGTGWHLKAGELISELSGSLSGPGITSDKFLYPGELREWVNNQWLADLLLFKVRESFGWSGLNSMVALNVLIIYFLVILGSFGRAGISPLISAVVLFLLLFMGAVQWIVRPVLFSFLFFSMLCHLILLERRSLISRSRLLALPLLFAFWCNFHPAFILGLVVIVLCITSCCAESLLEGKGLRETGLPFYLVLLIASVLATFCNPSGLGLWKNIFGLAGNKFFMNLNAEWLSPDFHLFYFFFFLVSFLSGMLLFLSGFRSRLNYLECGLLLVFSGASLLQRRYIPFFSIACALPLAILFQAWWESRREAGGSLARAFQSIEQKDVLRTRVRWTSLCFLLAIVGHNFFSNDTSFAPAMLPGKIVSALQEGPSNARILHSPDFGGQITFLLWPERSPTIDDRNQLNGQQAYVDFLDIYQGASGWEEKIRKGSFDWILVEKRYPLYKLLSQIPVQKRIGYRAGVSEGEFQLFDRFTDWDSY